MSTAVLAAVLGGMCEGCSAPKSLSPPVGRAAMPLPTLAPPLSMVVAGQRRRLVVCVVSDLAPSSGHAVWISSGNGSVLPSFAYGASQEDGGTVCSVSLLSNDLLAEGELACHVGANRTSPSHSSSPIRITGNEEVAELCPGSTAALLMAVRVVLLKVMLSDALLTSILLAQS
ncbi:PREDICTED: pre T-cell antigen receptor alpha isoform X2 [Lepidothrix coronata]|uniref:pre T-cell antigen receptor alpha isoform X2 n=1 Tax=Lepidothrix coronata TaxID=321398 RepID=UPI00081A2152|nr:PREDICTED: pre T-cell antigen receptor alpha isoform X2 [Lepidothrix coronata]